jgi:hypothetical protein
MVWKVGLTVACVYEVAALWTPLPTITTLTHRTKNHSVGRIAVWAAMGAGVWHFYVEGD